MAEENASPSPRRRAKGILLLAGLLLAALCLALGWFDVLLNPWARSVTGAPLLLDTWKGEVHMSTGEVRPMVVHIKRAPLHTGVCSGCATIDGTAKLCRVGGPPEEYTIGGLPHNWRGTRFYLSAPAVQERPPGTYTSLNRVEGEWDGADALRLRFKPDVVVIQADGSATTSSDTSALYPEMTVDLTRADADATC